MRAKQIQFLEKSAETVMPDEGLPTGSIRGVNMPEVKMGPGISAKPDDAYAAEEKVFRPHVENKKFAVTFVRNKLEAETQKMRKIFDVTGFRIEQVVKMTDLENPEGMERI